MCARVANCTAGCRRGFLCGCAPPVVPGFQLHQSGQDTAGCLVSLSNSWSNETLSQGYFGTYLLTLVPGQLQLINIQTHTHTVVQSGQIECVCVCVMGDCTSGTCKLTFARTLCRCGVCVLGHWPLAPLQHPWMFACFPSNKAGLKGGVCNCSWDNVKTNMTHWYQVMLQDVVRGHNGGRQSAGQVVAGLLEDNGEGLIS